MKFLAPAWTILVKVIRRVAARLEWALRPRGRRRLVVLLLGWAAIIGWQAWFAQTAPDLDRAFQNRFAVGMTNDREFLFFFKHLGLYPLKTRAPILADTRAEAERHLKDHASALVMEEGHAFRMGERGQIFLYWPETITLGGTKEASAVLGNGGAFVCALCALFAVLWWDRRPLLGALLVLVIGSDPFQLNEAYQRPNVFSWGITAAVLLLAAHIPLLRGRLSPRAAWLLPIGSALFLATARTLRAELLVLAAPVVAVYLIARLPWRRRLLMCGAFALTFLCAGLAWNTYFKLKFDQASRVLAKAGGTPYTGPFVLYHPVWHNLALGLSDFDKKKGWKWDDRMAYQMGMEALRKKYKMEIPPFKQYGYFLEKSYDGKGLYPVLAEEVPHYYDVIRDKVLADIKSDPVWYLNILRERAWRILDETTPLQLAAGKRFTRIPWNFFPVLPLIALCLAARRRFLSGLLLFTLPLSATPLLIYSGAGATFSAIAHLVGAAILATALLQGAFCWARLRLRARTAAPVAPPSPG
jgi:hypothetical protein